MPDVPHDHSFLQKLWDYNCARAAEQGLDLGEIFRQWAIENRNSLRKFGADTSFDDLCGLGCQTLPLAMIVAGIPRLVSLEMKWHMILGSPRKRNQTIRALEKAALALEDLQTSFADTVVAGFRNLVPSDLLTKTRNELIDPSQLKNTWPKDTAPHPAETIRALRVYASFLRKFGSLGKKTRINSTDTLWKYVFSAYVHKATGGFHDAQVSSVIGAVLNEGYDETAHRMWRSRNYERMDSDLSFLPKFLIYIGSVSSSSRA